MQLVKGQHSDYQMPPYSRIEQAVVFTNGNPKEHSDSFPIVLVQLSVFEINKMREEEKKNNRGKLIESIPTMFAVYDHDKLDFFPTPDKDYFVIIRFAGPIQEI